MPKHNAQNERIKHRYFIYLKEARRHSEATVDAAAIERRDQALVAFTLMTGARDGAIASLKLKHVDLIENCIYQDAREVNTKFSKTFRTYFFLVGADIREVLATWISYLKEEKLWGNDDPLFPATVVALGPTLQFQVSGLGRVHWRTPSPIRKIFREAFNNAGLPYFNPHSFRKTLAQLGLSRCQTAEQFKAWSQNLGHEKVLTTFVNYGEVACQRQGEIIRELAEPRLAARTNVDDIAVLARRLRELGFDGQ